MVLKWPYLWLHVRRECLRHSSTDRAVIAYKRAAFGGFSTTQAPLQLLNLAGWDVGAGELHWPENNLWANGSSALTPLSQSEN